MKQHSPRRLKNYLLQPLWQLRIGVYNIAISIGFSVVVFGILRWTFGGIIDEIILLTDVPDVVKGILNQYLRDASLWVLLAIVVLAIVNVGISIRFTHRLIGPSIAFRRHIRRLREGDYAAQTTLRKGDAFVEVAKELNLLSEELRDKQRSSGENGS